MTVDAISPATVRDALHALRYGQSLHRSPLVDLDLVTMHMRAEGLADTPESRAWALGQAIEAIVWLQLSKQRGTELGGPGTDVAPDTEFRLLGEDLSSGSKERAAWGLLYHRYLSTGDRPMREVTERYGLPKRTMADRLTRACESLAQVMRTAEVEASHRLADRPSSTVERIVVDEDAEEREEIEVLGALRGMLRTQQLTVKVSSGQLEDASHYPPTDLMTYRLGRIAEWSQPRHRLDSRFVELSLLVDMGEEAQSGRWRAKEERFTDLRDVLAAVEEPAIVLVGPPGSGKSTLLRRLELDLAIDALAGQTGGAESPITFLVSLNQYRAPVPGGPLPDPHPWLVERWAIRYPNLPALDETLAKGAGLLLLDGLNEMPHRDLGEYHERVVAWKRFLHDHVAPVPGNRMVVTCRSLDYSALLSTPRLRVPQVQLESMPDDKVREFLKCYSPGSAEEIWAAIDGTDTLEAVRWPFFLRLLVEQAADTGEAGGGLVELFTGFVRRALAREVERDNPLFKPGVLIDARDYQRIAAGRRWRTSWDLPEGGALIPSLSKLAYEMQAMIRSEESSQVRVGYDAAVRMLSSDHGAQVIDAGTELGVLDEDHAANEVMFDHQLLQQFFAARLLGKQPQADIVATPWRISDIRPGLREILDTLPRAETLPELPQTGWEETTILAAAMVGEPEIFLRDLMKHNLVVAGRAANTPGVQARLSEAFLEELRWALVGRSRDPGADLRHRIACGLAAGDLGDPRWERRTGPYGEYLVPPTVEIAGGAYPIGDDAPIEIDYEGGTTTAHTPRHEIEIGPFRIGQFPVTNAEYACFLSAGGYEDERWWDTAAGRDWRLGIGTAQALHENARKWLERFRAEPELLDKEVAKGTSSDTVRERWQQRLRMTEAELDVHLRECYPEHRFTEPYVWRKGRYDRPAQPVVGVCWHEARAYCAWLSAQTGEAYRLPTEVEWEAAARGQAGRAFAFGDAFDEQKANTVETRARRTTPVGVFVGGDTPEGVSDLSGNTWEWTSSLFGMDQFVPDYAYPYRAQDGRESAEAGNYVMPVVRGGAYNLDHAMARAAFRIGDMPCLRYSNNGFRLASPG